MAQHRLAHVMRQRPTATGPLGHHHLAAQTGQQPDRRVVDVGVQRLLRAAGHQRHPHPPRALGGEHLRIVVPADRRNDGRRHRQHRTQPRVRHQKRQRLGDLRAQQRQPKPHRIRDHRRQHPPQHPVHQRPPVGLLDILPRLIHQMHVMHARRAGGHAGQTRQTAVDMLDGARIRRPPGFQHLLDQIDPPARAVQLVAQHLIGRAGGGAEPAMHARPQNLIGPRQLRVRQLAIGEQRLHQPINPAFKIPRGSNCARSPAVNRATAGASG